MFVMEPLDNSKTEPLVIPLGTQGTVSGNRTNGQMIPVSTPTPGHLEELLLPLNSNGCGLTAEEEVAQHQHQNQHRNGRWEVTTLNPRHREIMRRILEGATYHDIAMEMGLHPQTIMLVATSKLFREELTKLEDGLNVDVIKRAEDMSNEALDVIKTLMRNARSEALKKSCADRILDTAGYSKVEKKIIGIVDGEAVIRELNKRRREAFENANAIRNIQEAEVKIA